MYVSIMNLFINIGMIKVNIQLKFNVEIAQICGRSSNWFLDNTLMRRELQVYDKLCPQSLVLTPEQNQRPLPFLLVEQFPRQVDIWRHQKRRTYGILFNFQSMNKSSRYVTWITWLFDSCHFNFTEILHIFVIWKHVMTKLGLQVFKEHTFIKFQRNFD